MSAASPERLLFVDGRVTTLDPSLPEAEAVLVEGGIVAACGPLKELRERAGKDATIFDLQGAQLRPAYHDAHTHLAEASAELAQLDLRGLATVAEAAARIARAVEARSGDSWVRGFGWDDPPDVRERLTVADLDAAAPDRPVLIGRGDGHAVLANAAARHALGLGAAGEGGGWLVEEEAARARAAAPAPAWAERRDALEAALARAATLGIARLEDVVDAAALDLYAAARERGRLPCRVGGWIPLAIEEGVAEDLRRHFPPGDPWIEVGTRKVFLDGTLMARTAALRAPYADARGITGEIRSDTEDLRARIRAADAGGWAVAFHAIGDAAVRLALDLVESCPGRPRSRPHRIEHVQVAAIEDLRRFSQIGVTASIQPSHHLRDAAFAKTRLGDRPGVVLYPAGSLLRAGALVAFGSDWPVGPLDPEETRDAILARSDGEALDEIEALRAATEAPARAAGRPAEWGRIVPGAPADLVVAGEGGAVLATFAGGRETWRSPGI